MEVVPARFPAAARVAALELPFEVMWEPSLWRTGLRTKRVEGAA
jgi:hypothetical protein